jgi:hypothetical protein
MASQGKHESPEMFLDRLRKMCQLTVRTSGDAREQAAYNAEAESRLLAAFVSGLTGAPGRMLRSQMPKTIEKALQMAIVATCTELEKRAPIREERGVKVFAVRGSREHTPEEGDDKPRDTKIQLSGTRSAGYQPRAGRHTFRVGGERTHSHRSDNRTSAQSRHGQGAGGGTKSGPKNGDDRYASRIRDIQCYNCELRGHVRKDCRRGQNRDLNGIGRPKLTPSVKPK